LSVACAMSRCRAGIARCLIESIVIQLRDISAHTAAAKLACDQ